MTVPGENETGPRGPTSQKDIVEAPMAKEDLQTAMLAMVMGELSKQRRSGGYDEGAEGFDGLRSMRVLQRSRAIKDQMARHPTRVVSEYNAKWENELDAEGRPWGWRGVAKVINFGRFKSMHRTFLMLGCIEKELAANKPKAAHAAGVQSMKAVHQFAFEGHRCTARKITGLANPYQKPRCGASALELEATLGGQKVEDDLRRRSKAVLAGTVERAGDGDETQPKGKGKSRTEDKEA